MYQLDHPVHFWTDRVEELPIPLNIMDEKAVE